MEKRKKFSYISSVKILKTANHLHLWRERGVYLMKTEK